jgi:hypothetical protein
MQIACEVERCLQEPLPQGKMGVVEDGPGCHAELIAAKGPQEFERKVEDF